MPEKEINLKEVKKIAVLRANSLGDFIFVLPALRALKETFPDSELIYLGNQWHKSFLEKRSGYIDKVYVVPKWNGIPHESDKIQDSRAAAAFFEEIQAEKLDIAFQMHGGGRNSNPFVLNLGAKLTVGLKTEDAIPLDVNIPYYLFQNEIFRYLEIVAKVGALTPHINPEIKVTKEDIDQLESNIGVIQKPFIVLHPGASDIRRRWPVERFAEIGNYLASKGYYIYITGVKEELELTEKLKELIEYPSENLSLRISINELLAIVSEASLVISNDTGPLHLARAANTPNIGIYWGANLVTAGPAKVEYSITCQDWSIHCPSCGADSTKANFNNMGCSHQISFVQNVTVEEVKKHASFLIKKNKLVSNPVNVN